MYKHLATVATILTGLLVFQSSAEARHHRKQHYVRAISNPGFHPDCNVTMPCAGAPAPVYAATTGPLQPKLYSLTAKGKKRYPHQANLDIVGTKPYLNPAKAARAVGRAIIGATGLVPTLASKVAELTSNCNCRVVSGVRHTNIAGTRIPSLHNYGQAVDIAGDYGCIRSRLAGWPGGYSVDNVRMRHIHISYAPDSGREMGARFVHGGGWGKRRYARHRGGRHYAVHRHHNQYVSARRARHANAAQ